jgi:hypothetical protein
MHTKGAFKKHMGSFFEDYEFGRWNAWEGAEVSQGAVTEQIVPNDIGPCTNYPR